MRTKLGLDFPVDITDIFSDGDVDCRCSDQMPFAPFEQIRCLMDVGILQDMEICFTYSLDLVFVSEI